MPHNDGPSRPFLPLSPGRTLRLTLFEDIEIDIHDLILGDHERGYSVGILEQDSIVDETRMYLQLLLRRQTMDKPKPRLLVALLILENILWSVEIKDRFIP